MKTLKHENMGANGFKNQLKNKMNIFVHSVYKVTKKFPKEELYGATSQLRRSALSVILNYIEGYGRAQPKSQLQFFRIAYGSLQEAKYLLQFAFDESYFEQSTDIYDALFSEADEIGAMLWTELANLENKLSQ